MKAGGLVRGWLAIVQTGEVLTPAGTKYWPELSEQGARGEGKSFKDEGYLLYVGLFI